MSSDYKTALSQNPSFEEWMEGFWDARNMRWRPRTVSSAQAPVDFGDRLTLGDIGQQMLGVGMPKPKRVICEKPKELDALYAHWATKIPTIPFHVGWDVRAVPPYGEGVLVRYEISYAGQNISVVLVEKPGVVTEAGWRVLHTDWWCGWHRIDALVDKIEKLLGEGLPLETKKPDTAKS
ncbi:MAG: hypothetical protein AAGK37_19305 [Pseudomonadota bacterium]